MNKKIQILLLLVGLVFSLQGKSLDGLVNNPSDKIRANRIEVKLNKNVETIGVILCLSDVGDYVLENYQEKEYTWVKIIRERFAKYKKHAAVVKTNALDKYGLLGFGNYYYGLGYSSLPEFEKQYSVLPMHSDSLSTMELESLLNDYDQSIRDFYQEAKMEEYFDDFEKIYQEVEREISSTLPQGILSTMEQYFGISGNEYIITPSITIFSGFNFGPNISTDKKEIFYYLLGPAYDISQEKFAQGNLKDSLGFDDKDYVFELAIHEFGHSFLRFLSKKKNREEIMKLEYLNSEQLKENLEAIGEGQGWETGFEEHFVRANEIMIWRAMGKQQTADEKLKYEIEEEGLVYLNEFVISLEKYQMNRKKYPTMESYLPTLLQDISKIKIK